MTQLEHVQRNYKLKFQESRVKEFASSPTMKSLSEEIGMVRLMLETIWNRCSDENDLLMYQSRIESLVHRIERMLQTCDRLDTKAGQTLNRTQIINMGQSIVDIISKHITDPFILQQIATELSDVTVKCLTSEVTDG